MRFPCELISEPYLTQIRMNITHNLREQGYSQNQIAELLQVTQPVISGYLKKIKIDREIDSDLQLKSQFLANKVSKLIISKGIHGINQSIEIICQECKIMRQAGPICTLHKQQVAYLDNDCRNCHSSHELINLQIDKYEIINELITGIEQIQNHRNINKIIPEIGMQLILGIKEMTTMLDIAAFPSRINKRKHSNPLFERPIFGGSETMSQFLLHLNQFNTDITCAISIKTTKLLLNRLSNINIKSIDLDGFDINYKNIELNQIKQLPLIVIDKGIVGYEAISYLIASTMDILVETTKILLNQLD
ncbi:MAG: hypothetical protein OEZ01_01755 [Candidatus Heimdallarchaeota archaeon]|nr:hypothetical protein [Candidatus Heimdallarchaeota archaeon]MDH5644698.1 hypothetical protein [Candidatus Heimdallarchaeota archaeon]